MDLSERLKTIADMVKNCDVLCDVGTDHAYIPIYLVKNGVAKKAIACDVRPGPVSIASKNIFQSGLEDFIETRLGDGLKPVKNNECDCAVIAGMGGLLIKKIIDDSFYICTNLKQLVLQPMNAQAPLRKYLYNEGFDITYERLVKEENKFYTVISAVYTGKIQNDVPELLLEIGERLIQYSDPLLPLYLEKQIAICEKILADMENISPRNYAARFEYKLRKDNYEAVLKVMRKT